MILVIHNHCTNILKKILPLINTSIEIKYTNKKEYLIESNIWLILSIRKAEVINR